MMKSDFFNKLIRDSTTGSVRQTLRFEKLASIKAPVPSVSEQKKTLKAYHDTLNESKINKKAGDDFESTLLFDIQSKVSDLKKSDLKIDKPTSIMQVTPFTATKRWEVGYILKEGRLEKIYNSFKFTNYCINDLQTESLFGLSVKASLDKKKDMIPVLRMSNVINGMLDFSELKYLPKTCATTNKEPEKWLLKEGDFLITRTNGSKDLVGKSAVFHEDGIYTYASYLIRYRFDTTIVLPEYINILFMTPLVREQIAVMRRQGGGQYNLNSDEIGAIQIPVPSIPEQQLIISYFNSTKDGANSFYAKAEKLKIKAITDFEKAIFL